MTIICTNNLWVPGDMQALIGSRGVGPSRRCLDLIQSESRHNHPANVPPQQLATYHGNQYAIVASPFLSNLAEGPQDIGEFILFLRHFRIRKLPYFLSGLG